MDSQAALDNLDACSAGRRLRVHPEALLDEYERKTQPRRLDQCFGSPAARSEFQVMPQALHFCRNLEHKPAATHVMGAAPRRAGRLMLLFGGHAFLRSVGDVSSLAALIHDTNGMPFERNALRAE
jgi:hypothetical protein